jgi:hypothetical protein
MSLIIPQVKAGIYKNRGKNEIKWAERRVGETDAQLYSRIYDGLLYHSNRWNNFIKGVNSGSFTEIYDAHMKAIFEASRKQIEENIKNSWDNLDARVRNKILWNETVIPKKLADDWWKDLTTEDIRLVLTFAVPDSTTGRQRGGLSAPLLVLFPSGGLHHGAARLRFGERDHSGPRP